MSFSQKTRSDIINHLKNDQLDVLAIGGGITGAGVALQAAAAHLKTGLIEMQDFAEGTSSRSTKLVHGGIRYLKTFDVEVVADTVQERAVVQRIAPHIPRPKQMILPIYDEPEATFSMFSVKIAMDLYDKLANVTGEFANKVISKEEVLQLEPDLDPHNLLGAGIYLDFENNDARLVIENIKQAAADGGLMASHVQALQINHNEKGQVNGVHVRDLLTQEEFDIRAKIVINTAGPWSDQVRKLDTKYHGSQQIRPTKGVHLVVDDSKLKVPTATYFDTGKQDGRMVFVIPRFNKTYFGTTDTDYQGDFQHPEVTQADVDYLLEIINRRYPHVHLTIDDIEASWAGLRPLLSANGGSDYNGGTKKSISETSFNQLIKAVNQYQSGKIGRSAVEKVLNNLQAAQSEKTPSASSVSRGSSLTVDDDGLLNLAGGKITDYRKMAAGALQKIKSILAADFAMQVQLPDSKKLQVAGGHFDPTQVDENIKKYTQIGVDKGLSEAAANKIANLFGSNAPQIFALADHTTAAPGLSLGETLALHYSLDNEMTLTAVDYLLRRTNHILFEADTIDQIKQPVIDEMARYFQWDNQRKQQETENLDKAIQQSQLADLKGQDD
ncbi:type 1 glycerol-3-phosphate oxidase [Bombilactobacillus bombi]|uniref:type 1 glycerol-3-phosphate oxidase n=1 Tax=Bombilactobacillus bombi TaxID=1303590 RepID=UPI000E56A65F|nr:type 1 glycerol-3-phosphate oxidase [Bombilactobacillus bombi]AXX65262.1 type 1 glycerol-3-phosphate oxidase [Bombilactobacillus bombi]